jgi:hypothetical protein
MRSNLFIEAIAMALILLANFAGAITISNVRGS